MRMPRNQTCVLDSGPSHQRADVGFLPCLSDGRVYHDVQESLAHVPDKGG